jgi:uncharacterized protein
MDITNNIIESNMRKLFTLILVAAGFMALFTGCKKSEYRALVITGQDIHHDWKASYPVLKTILDASGLFSTDVAITPEKGSDMSKFKPVFSKYNVVVIDYCGDSWPDKTKQDFIEYVNNGGGVVIYHGSSIAFPDWKEYNEITGLGGWDGRDKSSGPYIYYRNNKLVIDDTSSGAAGFHGSRREFEIRTRNREHPIMKGLPSRWMHATDELYTRLRGPGKNIEILATANSDSTGRGRGKDEPMIMTVAYGKGRVFHTMMGHAEADNITAMQCSGFITILQRGAEWAASGSVTLPVPNDFPTAADAVLRTGFVQLTLEDDFLNIVTYEIGKSTRYLTDIQANIRQAAGDPEKMLMIEKMMTAVLKNKDATIDSKKLMLRELSWMGSGYSHEAIKELADDPQLKDEAGYAIERLGIK